MPEPQAVSNKGIYRNIIFVVILAIGFFLLLTNQIRIMHAQETIEDKLQNVTLALYLKDARQNDPELVSEIVSALKDSQQLTN